MMHEFSYPAEVVYARCAAQGRIIAEHDSARRFAHAWKRAARNQRARAEQAEWAWGGWQERAEAAEAELKALAAELKRINDASRGEVK